MGAFPAKALILVVEDNAEVRDVITIYLRRNGYAVAEAADGVAGLEAVATLKPSLVLLDVLLPKLDGIEVLKRLRSADSSADLPVVMMSAVLQTRDLQAETARLNVSSFLQKPFQMRTLMDHVDAALNVPRKSADNVDPAKPTAAARDDWRAERRLQMVRTALPLQGSLSDIPVPEILHGIFVESRTALLQICSGTIDKRVFFQNGLPVYAESSIPEETLGSHLVRRGRISKEEHDTARSEMTRTGRHFGEILLKLGLLGPHDLFTELELHLTDKVISTFGWFDGTFRIQDGDSWKEDVIVARMKPGRILLDGLQRFWTPANVQRRLRITDDSRTFPLDSSPYSEDQLGLSTQETRIMQMVRRGLTVGEIIKQIGELNLATSTLYALFVMEYLGFVLSTRQRTQATGRPEPSSASDLRDTREERSKALLAEYLKFRTADYFKLLGVSREASPEEISASFKERQRRYHPDTLVGIDTGLVHEKIEELFVRIHNAYRTLIDPSARARYLQQLDDKEEGAPMTSSTKTGRFATIKKKAQDEILFEEGFALLRNGDVDRAHELFLQAEQISPKPRYTAHRVWSAYLIDPVGKKQDAEKALARLRKENPEEALYPYLLGSLALREKDGKRAEFFFDQSVRIDPQHIDSARQLRILRMRQQTSEASGLFELFKRK